MGGSGGKGVDIAWPDFLLSLRDATAAASGPIWSYSGPGRPRNNWLDQLRNDSTRPTGELWRRAVDRGHGGATTRRPSPATRT